MKIELNNQDVENLNYIMDALNIKKDSDVLKRSLEIVSSIIYSVVDEKCELFVRYPIGLETKLTIKELSNANAV